MMNYKMIFHINLKIEYIYPVMLIQTIMKPPTKFSIIQILENILILNTGNIQILNMMQVFIIQLKQEQRYLNKTLNYQQTKKYLTKSKNWNKMLKFIKRKKNINSKLCYFNKNNLSQIILNIKKIFKLEKNLNLNFQLNQIMKSQDKLNHQQKNQNIKKIKNNNYKNILIHQELISPNKIFQQNLSKIQTLNIQNKINLKNFLNIINNIQQITLYKVVLLIVNKIWITIIKQKTPLYAKLTQIPIILLLKKQIKNQINITILLQPKILYHNYHLQVIEILKCNNIINSSSRNNNKYKNRKNKIIFLQMIRIQVYKVLILVITFIKNQIIIQLKLFKIKFCPIVLLKKNTLSKKYNIYKILGKNKNICKHFIINHKKNTIQVVEVKKKVLKIIYLG